MCEFAGCDRQAVARGLCKRHHRWASRNDALPALATPEERFWRKVDRRGDDCWLWLGSLTIGGYGRFALGHSDEVKAHRYAYELLVAPIPEGLDLDHLCHDPDECSLLDDCPHRRCVNPAHLEPVTRRENLLRAGSFQRENAAKTHCLRDHEFTPENTRLYRGMRHCRTCARERAAQRRKAA